MVTAEPDQALLSKKITRNANEKNLEPKYLTFGTKMSDAGSSVTKSGGDFGSLLQNRVLYFKISDAGSSLTKSPLSDFRY